MARYFQHNEEEIIDSIFQKIGVKYRDMIKIVKWNNKCLGIEYSIYDKFNRFDGSTLKEVLKEYIKYGQDY